MRLHSLTGLRFVGAMLVVLLHSVVNRSNPEGLTTIPGVSSLASMGYLGVTFFFVLSGFVLTWTFRPGERARDFYRRRFARVYPLHAATWGAAMLAAVVTGGGFALVGGLLSLTLLQAWVPDRDVYFAGNGASWSLACEAFFYALTPVLAGLLIMRRRPLTTASVSLGVMLAAAVWQTQSTAIFDTGQELWVFPPFALGAFVVGMSAAHALREGYRIPITVPQAMAVAGAVYLALVLVAGATDLSRALACVPFAGASAVVILAAARADLEGRRSVFAASPIVKLGEWSFALYLLHPILLKAVADLAGYRATGLAESIVAEIGLIAAAVAVSAAAYRFWEAPLERLLRRPRRRAAPSFERVRAAAPPNRVTTA